MPYTYDPATDFRPLIRCASHRARQALEQLLRSAGAQADPYYSWETACTGGIVAIPLRLLADATRIKGCTRASLRYSYHRCLR